LDICQDRLGTKHSGDSKGTVSASLLCGTASNSSGGSRSFVVGAGFTRRTVDCGGGISLNQTLLAPFGDDPVVLSLVTISASVASAAAAAAAGLGNSPPDDAAGALSLEYAEGWSASAWQVANGQSTAQRRAFQQASYNTSVAAAGAGCVEMNAVYTGRRCQDCPTDSRQVPPNASLWDEDPPATFFSDISATQEGARTDSADVGCSAQAFWAGGAAEPALGMSCPSPSGKAADGVLAARKQITLSAGGSVSLAFVYGYLPALEQETFSREALLEKYKAKAAAPEQLLEETAAAWRTATISLNLTSSSQHPDAESIAREVAWCEKRHLFLSFPYVCPEPVLVK